MTNKKTFDAKTIGFTSVALLLGMGFATAVGVSAHGDGLGVRGNVDPEQHEAIMEALESRDYDAWEELVAEARPQTAENMTEERFETMADRHEDRVAHREEVEAAIEEGDYDEWSELMSARKARFLEVITENNFSVFQELHEAREDGDTERVEELREELGLDQGVGEGKGRGHGRGMHRGVGSGDGINNRWSN